MVNKDQIGILSAHNLYTIEPNIYKTPITDKNSRILKIALLYNEKLIIDTNDNAYYHHISNLSKLFSVERKILYKIILPISSFINLDNKSEFEIEKEFSSNAPKSIKRKLFNEINKSIKENYGMTNYQLRKTLKEGSVDLMKDQAAAALFALESAYHWSEILKSVKCNFLGFQEHEVLAARYYFNSFRVIDNNKLFIDLSIIIPSIQDLQWSDIFELREDKRISAFRDLIFLNKSESELLKKDYYTDIVEDLWQAIDRFMPNTYGELFKGIFSNIPLPFPNPVSVASSLKSIKDSFEFNKNYESLIFLFDVRKRINDRKLQNINK